jgi:signal transduction histidine kinase/ligand-binding sensor domain-containing protein
MSQSSTISVREPLFELRSNLTLFASANVAPRFCGKTSHIVRLAATHNRIASGIKSWSLLCLFLISSIFLLSRAYALDPNRRISQYGHSIWRTQDGFQPNPDFTQTADGYILMIGPEGFFRFDGSQFVPYVLPNGTLPGRSIVTLFGSHDGSLWIGGSGGLGLVRDGKLSTLQPTDGAGTSNILEDHAGNMWVTRYRVPEGKGALCEVVGVGLHCYGPADGVPAGDARGLAEDRAGYLWFAGKSLYRWKPGTKATQYQDRVKHPEIVDVAVDHSGDVWVAMDGVGPQFGVRYLHNGVWAEYSTAGFHSSRLKANSLFVDRDGAVWIATENDGLYRVSGGAVDHFSKAEGLTGLTVSQIMEDHEGNLWVSTDGGMDMFRNLPATNYSVDDGLSAAIRSSVFVASDGVVWAGAYDAREWTGERSADILLPGPNQRFAPGPKLPGKIESMFQDHTGALWFGLGNSLSVYEHGRVEKVLDRDGQVLRLDSTPAILEDPTQTILALSKTHLFLIRDRRLIRAITLPQPLPNLGLLVADPSEGILIVGRGELMRYQGDIVQNYSLPGGQESTGVMDLIADTADPLMLATLKGLLRWDGKQWQVLNAHNGFPCTKLLSFIKDRHGSLWIESPCGLLKVEASELEKWRRKEVRQPSVSVFDLLDGARIGRPFTIQPVMSLAPDGRLWFSNEKSIESIDPDQTYENTLPPPVHVEELIANGKPYQVDGQPHIPPNPRNLEIDYTGVSFSVPQRVQFRYLLEGHDKTWQGPVTRRQAFYTDLPPGTYRFHVTASNNSSVWNEVGAVAVFVVEPAFYQTLWFKSLIAIAIVGMMWALYLLRLRQATDSVRERLLAQMEERERIARELHDTLLQGFQGITLRMQGVSKNLPIQDPLRKMIEEVLDRGDEVLREARQRVRNLRRRTTDANELPDRLTKCGKELSKDHVAAFTLAIVGKPKVLESTVQDEAYRIVVEALTNAFRHASASKIETEVTYDSSALRITVRDDGVGIDNAVLSDGQPGHWGLTGMRERAHAIRAELKLWSRESAGTEVELVIPASIAYPRDQRKPVESEPFRV